MSRHLALICPDPFCRAESLGPGSSCNLLFQRLLPVGCLASLGGVLFPGPTAVISAPREVTPPQMNSHRMEG